MSLIDEVQDVMAECNSHYKEDCNGCGFYFFGGCNVSPEVRTVLDKMEDFCKEVEHALQQASNG